DQLPPDKAEGLLLNAMNIAPEFEAEFNEWYDKEHIPALAAVPGVLCARRFRATSGNRSEEHTSELQSLTNLVCRLLLEKKNEAGGAHIHTPDAVAPSPPAGPNHAHQRRRKTANTPRTPHDTNAQRDYSRPTTAQSHGLCIRRRILCPHMLTRRSSSCLSTLVRSPYAHAALSRFVVCLLTQRFDLPLFSPSPAAPSFFFFY